MNHFSKSIFYTNRICPENIQTNSTKLISDISTTLSTSLPKSSASFACGGLSSSVRSAPCPNPSYLLSVRFASYTKQIINTTKICPQTILRSCSLSSLEKYINHTPSTVVGQTVLLPKHGSENCLISVTSTHQIKADEYQPDTCTNHRSFDILSNSLPKQLSETSFIRITPNQRSRSNLSIFSRFGNISSLNSFGSLNSLSSMDSVAPLTI